MGLAFGAQIGFAEESTYGTIATPDHFVPLLAGDTDVPEEDIEFIQSAGMIAGRRIQSVKTLGNITVEKSFGFEVYAGTIGLLFRHMFGASATTGSGPYTHTITPGNQIDGKGLTIQVGVPNLSTTAPFALVGGKITKAQVKAAAGEIATCSVDVAAQSVDATTALATASYTTPGVTPMVGGDASATIGGVSTNVKEWTLDLDIPRATGRRFLGTRTIAEPVESGAMRKVTGELVLEYAAATQRTRFVAGTEFALVIVLAAGSSTLTATLNCYYTGHTIDLGSDYPHNLSLPFEAISSTSDAAAATIVLENADTTL